MKINAILLLVPLLLVGGSVKESSQFLQGKKLYEETCISCHGEDGTTNPNMKLTVKPRRLTESILREEQMFKMIRDGARAWGANSDMMPAFKYVYDEKKLKSVALYISKAFNGHRDERIQKLLSEVDKIEIDSIKMLRIGKKIFNRNCSLCHGITGNGESAYVEKSKNNQEFLYPYNLTKILLSEEQIFLYAREGGHFWGTDKEDMPSWKKKYNDQQLRSVAKYVKEKIVKNSF